MFTSPGYSIRTCARSPRILLTFLVRQVVLGQFIGIGLLIAISALGSLISLVVLTYIIGLMGIIPIVIGVKNLVEIRKKDKSPSRQAVQDKKNRSYLSFLSVAAVTFSNGGDNIGVYVPLSLRLPAAE
jgi:cadmium resistance protein CadD (predicted permease)